VIRSGALVLVTLAGLVPGCATVRRDSLKIIDAQVQKQPRLQRARARGGFRLGPYTIVQRRLREHALDQIPAVTIDGPRHPGWRWELELELAIDRGGAPWRASCVGQRQANVDADFAAISEIANDTVTIECELLRERARWRFFAAGRLDQNIAGELHLADAPPEAPPDAKVEIMLWMKRIKLISRHLAEPVAQVRRGDHVVAAMVLSRPEWAWVRTAEGAELRGVAMATLAAIRLLPLGFDE
jgi:hypothetical protein